MKRTLAGVLLVCAPAAALAATRVEDLVVKPNPAERQVEIAVTVNRDQFDVGSLHKARSQLFSPGGLADNPALAPEGARLARALSRIWRRRHLVRGGI